VSGSLRRRARRVTIGILVAAAFCSLVPGGADAQPTVISVDWNAYLFGSLHSSTTTSNAITTGNAANLSEAWHWSPAPPTITGQPPGQIFGTPTVVGNRAFIGSNTGVFSALDLATGNEIWHQFLGYVPKLTCQAKGIAATATVITDASTGKLTVYEAGGDGYLYALDAETGAIIWRSVIALASSTSNDWYDWSSPTVANGRVYIGLTSQCDNPLTRGGVREFDQATGDTLATYWAVPAGVVGGGVWSSVAATSDAVYATTGTPPPQGQPPGTDSVSIVRLDPTTLQRLDKWSVTLNPPGADQDFGASPVVFTTTIGGQATELVGAMNKNGVFYAWRSHDLAAGPVWQYKVDSPVTPSIPAAVWDGSRLFVSGNQTTIDGVTYSGSIRELDPSTGALIWETGLQGAVLGTPSLNGSGVLAVATYDSLKGVPIKGAANATYLINAATGAILARYSTNNDVEFAQPIFVNRYLLLGTVNKGLFAYTPSVGIFADDFETGTLAKWRAIKNTQVQSTEVDTGAYALRATSAGAGGTASAGLPATQTDLTVTARFKIISQSTTAGLLALKDSAGKAVLSLSATSVGRLQVRNGVIGKTVTSPTTVSPGSWHTLRIHLVEGSLGQYSVRLDDTWIAKLSVSAPLAGNPIGTLQLGDGIANRFFDIAFDNLQVTMPSP
jgi:outer membrane protein assembly factor BamB